MCQMGDRYIQAGFTLAFSDEKAKEHPKGRRALLSSGPSPPLVSLQDKPSQILGVEHSRIVSKSLEQLPNRNATEKAVMRRPIAINSAIVQRVFESGSRTKTTETRRARRRKNGT
jgi:hypothetical protein